MNDINIGVRAYPIDEPKNNVRAFASVSVDDLIAIRGIRVMDSEKGLFVTMPQSKDNDGDYHDIAFPINGDLRKDITAAVLAEYDRVMALAPDARGYEAQETGVANKRAVDVQMDIRVYPIDEPKGSTRAFASVGIEEMVAIRGIRVVEGAKGMFVSMPQSKDKDGDYHDIAFPMNGDLRKEINKAILAEFNSLDKPFDRKPSLAEGLKHGAEKAAAYSAAPRAAAAVAKSHGGSMLE